MFAASISTSVQHLLLRLLLLLLLLLLLFAAAAPAPAPAAALVPVPTTAATSDPVVRLLVLPSWLCVLYHRWSRWQFGSVFRQGMYLLHEPSSCHRNLKGVERDQGVCCGHSCLILQNDLSQPLVAFQKSPVLGNVWKLSITRVPL